MSNWEPTRWHTAFSHEQCARGPIKMWGQFVAQPCTQLIHMWICCKSRTLRGREKMTAQTRHLSVFISIYIYICNAYMYICIYVYMYICTYVYLYICTYVYMYICIYVNIYVYMYICIYVYMYICIYVYMYICIYVYMFICIYVYLKILGLYTSASI